MFQKGSNMFYDWHCYQLECISHLRNTRPCLIREHLTLPYTRAPRAAHFSTLRFFLPSTAALSFRIFPRYQRSSTAMTSACSQFISLPCVFPSPARSFRLFPRYQGSSTGAAHFSSGSPPCVFSDPARKMKGGEMSCSGNSSSQIWQGQWFLSCLIHPSR